MFADTSFLLFDVGLQCQSEEEISAKNEAKNATSVRAITISGVFPRSLQLSMLFAFVSNAA
jgi:hypothetical protein